MLNRFHKSSLPDRSNIRLLVRRIDGGGWPGAAGPPGVRRQDRWREPNALALRRAAVAKAQLAYFHWADAGLNGPLRQMAMPHKTLAAIFADQIGVSGKKRGDLGLHRLRQKLVRAVAQNIGEWIGEASRLA